MGKALPPLALIAGPTASGKSSLAVELAQRTDGVVINADSAQLYRDLDIVTARPSPAELSAAEHRLYGVRDGVDPCSAAHWAELASGEIDRAHAAGRLPILVGGTGLYVRTLLDGIAPIPPIDEAIRQEIRAAPLASNRAALETLDPDAFARLRPGDTTRIARALEVVRSTGRPIASWQRQRTGGIGGLVSLRPLILLPPREWLHMRCDARFEAMLEAGAIEEVERLLNRRLDPALPVMRAIGVPEIAALLRGEATVEQTIEAGKQATRRYAKRQYTWFSRQPPTDWPRLIEPLDELTTASALALFDAAA